MTFFVKTTAPTPSKTKEARQMSLLLAGILVVFLVAQLFTFEEFLTLFASFNLPISERFSYALAPIIVTAELFALPFLLGMRVSIAFRYLSMACGWLVALLWTLVTAWVVTTYQQVETVGFLGTVVNLVPGWWAIFVSISLGILSAWASWGAWPRHKHKK